MQISSDEPESASGIAGYFKKGKFQFGILKGYEIGYFYIKNQFIWEMGKAEQILMKFSFSSHHTSFIHFFLPKKT